MTVVFPLEDLPMFWQGRANALRILAQEQTRTDRFQTYATADCYEVCANDLRNSLANFFWGKEA